MECNNVISQLNFACFFYLNIVSNVCIVSYLEERIKLIWKKTTLILFSFTEELDFTDFQQL